MKDQQGSLSRRQFFQGAGVLAAGAAVAGTSMGLVGCAEAKSESADYLPDSWDYETDIAVVGFGGAGAAAAITAVNENLGDVLVLEAAPEAQAGGNTRVSMNLIMIPNDVDGIITYQKALNGPYEVEDDLLHAWAESMYESNQWFKDLGIDLVQMSSFSPEFPEQPGCEAVSTYCVDGVVGMNSCWNALKEQCDYLGVQVLYETRGVKLIRNPFTNEALGVVAEQDGKSINIKARKGVVLSCGGFENDPEMCRNYFALGDNKHPLGTPYNVGDGIRMVTPFGAQLWHMNNVSGSGLAIYAEGLDKNAAALTPLGSHSPLHSFVFVGKNGQRFMYEELCGNIRHGKTEKGGSFIDFMMYDGTYAIFDQAIFDNVPIASYNKMMTTWPVCERTLPGEDNNAFLEAGTIIKGDTPEELAEKLGMPPEMLKSTIEEYNTCCSNGSDPEFHRGEAVYAQFGGQFSNEKSLDEGKLTAVVEAFPLEPISGPLYATPLASSIVNTQGGPKRNTTGQLVDSENQPIGRLFGAGEFGCVYGYMYNGGGNVGEAIASGRVAARGVGTLTAWDEAKKN